MISFGKQWLSRGSGGMLRVCAGAQRTVQGRTGEAQVVTQDPTRRRIVNAFLPGEVCHGTATATHSQYVLGVGFECDAGYGPGDPAPVLGSVGLRVPRLGS